MLHWQLFIAFFRVGILGYGGGPSSIPLVHKEVEKYNWMDSDDFSDVLAIANTLPGPIATKMAGYIGYRVAGWPGAINAVLATIIPSILAMIILLMSLTSFKDNPWVIGMTSAIVPVVGVMLAVLTFEFFQKSKKDLGWGACLLLTIGSLVLIEWIGLHPAFLIFGLLLVAIGKKDKQAVEDENVQKGVEL